jgi:methyl coenzyme M reductase subunit C-like uncharacterized protein (methanogenesis marker protein 7)
VRVPRRLEDVIRKRTAELKGEVINVNIAGLIISWACRSGSLAIITG